MYAIVAALNRSARLFCEPRDRSSVQHSVSMMVGSHRSTNCQYSRLRTSDWTMRRVAIPNALLMSSAALLTPTLSIQVVSTRRPTLVYANTPSRHHRSFSLAGVRVGDSIVYVCATLHCSAEFYLPLRQNFCGRNCTLHEHLVFEATNSHC